MVRQFKRELVFEFEGTRTCLNEIRIVFPGIKFFYENITKTKKKRDERQTH